MSGNITPEMIKTLRERTGVGMGKCKKALDEAGGDMERAIDNLRKSGIASAVKKEAREAKEGVIAYGESSQNIALMEVCAETDFVTQNDTFTKFVDDLTAQAAETHPESIEAFLQETDHKDSSLTIDQKRALTTQSLGENIQITRLNILTKTLDSSAGIYSHMKGKIVVVVELTVPGKESLAREIAMHVAAEAPDYLKPEDVPEDVRSREEDIARSQVQNKPANIIDKIVLGKLEAFYKQSCLLKQAYVKDPSMTITQLLEMEAKKIGKPVSISRFIRWQVGE